jgi:hypothetical protein
LEANVQLTHAAERLIERHVDSVGALDLLLLVHRERQRDWGLEELCQVLRCPAAWAETQLVGFAAIGLVDEADGRFRYRAGQHGRAVDQIARACRHERAGVVRLIFAGSGGVHAGGVVRQQP